MQSDQEPHGHWVPAEAVLEPAPTGEDPVPAGDEPVVSPADETERYERRLSELDTALAEVERALHRLDDGTYGTCEVCGRPTEPQNAGVPSAGLRCGEHR